MNQGVLLFAQNTRQVDYLRLSILSAKLAVKNLQVPVSLVTDWSTLEWARHSNQFSTIRSVFDQIIEIDRPQICNNFRYLSDGNDRTRIPFVNDARTRAYELTPYDRTLLIDSDFLINSSMLSEYWKVDIDVMISERLHDLAEFDRIGYHDRYISDTGIHLYWATAVMFSKSETARYFFNLVNHVKTNYVYYADLFRFDYRIYRNDIAFSIAKHIIDGYETNLLGNLPPILSTFDKDVLIDVKDHRLLFLINAMNNSKFYAASIEGRDIHVMNKQSIIRNYNQLLEIA